MLMELKKLEVPTSSITEVKKSPMDVFQQARDAKTGVYIFNREKIAGVMLTQQQYEDLLTELHDLRKQLNTNQDQMIVSADIDELESFAESIRDALVTGSSISAKNLDERMVAFGFITKKTGFGGVVEMLNELKETGKIIYHLRKRTGEISVIAEVVGESDNQSTMFDKIIIRKVYLKTKMN